MEKYESNSHKSKEGRLKAGSEKKIEKVITGSAKPKKKNGLQKLTNVFVPQDVDDVKAYVFEDIIVPAIKDIILDAVKAFLGTNGRSGKNTAASKISYGGYYERDNDRKRDYGSSLTRTAGYSYDNIILDRRGEAEEVLLRMDELIDTYGLVSVADLYDLVGVTGNYTDNKYGWTDIHSASVARVRDGYLIKLPKALPLN